MPPMIFSRRLGDFLHWPGARDGKFPPLLLEVLNDFFNHLAKVSEHLDRIISMNPRDQIRAPSDVDLVTFTPPTCGSSHLLSLSSSTVLIASLTCFS